MLGGDQEVRIAVGLRHADHSAGSSKALRISCGIRRMVLDHREVDFQRRTELEETTFHRVPDEIDTTFESVIAKGLGDIVSELPLALEGLLRNVGVGTKLSAREDDQRSVDIAGDQVIPILTAEGELIDRIVGKNGTQGEVGELEMIVGVVPVGQIAGAVGLIVLAVVGLRVVAHVGGILPVDGPIEAAVIASFVERPRDDESRLGSQSGVCGDSEFVERGSCFREALAFALALDSEEGEELVL